MFSEELFLELIGSIYDAAGNPELWPDFLQRLATITRSHFAEFGYLDQTLKAHHLEMNTGVDSAAARDYEAYYSQQNVWVATAPESYWKVGFVGTSHQIVTDRRLERTEFYQDWLRGQRFHYGMTGIVLKDDSRFSSIAILRSKAEGPYNEAEKVFLQRLLPHVQRAMALHRRIAGLKIRSDCAEDLLDRLPVGMLLVGAKGKILMLNRRARAIIEQNDGLIVRREGVQVSRADEANQLRWLIHGATMTGARKGMHPGGAMTVSRPSMRRPYEILVSPLRTGRSWLGAEQPIAAIFITDPEIETERQDQVIGRLFGLTPAESRLADALLHGKSLKEAAEEFGVTRNTVHSQLQKIFEKTGTNRQSELLRLILNSPASLR